MAKTTAEAETKQHQAEVEVEGQVQTSATATTATPRIIPTTSVRTVATQSQFTITPPLLNSANPWATTLSDLRSLYESPYLGAVTVRTSLLKGFPHDARIHQYTFFSSTQGVATAKIDEGRSEVKDDEGSSLNTLGYSPISLDEYLDILVQIVESPDVKIKSSSKPFIVSVSGSAHEIEKCYHQIWKVGKENPNLNLMMEINLSCPNILNKPPPAYDGASLAEYIDSVSRAKAKAKSNTFGLGGGGGGGDPDNIHVVHVGIKTPPYTYQDQYTTLIRALESSISSSPTKTCPLSFITATNTLGSCLVLNPENNNKPALNSATGSGIGGMAGEAIHPLALGNVKTIRMMLDSSSHTQLKNIAIIGIGGVSDAAGFKRMKSVGAYAVGVGTALGREGISVFKKISQGLSESDLVP